MEKVILDEHNFGLTLEVWRKTAIKGEEKKITTIEYYVNGELEYASIDPYSYFCTEFNGLFKYVHKEHLHIEVFKKNIRNGALINFKIY